MYKVKCPKCGEEFIYSAGCSCPHCNTTLNVHKIKWDIVRQRKKIRNKAIIIFWDVIFAIIMTISGRTTTNATGLNLLSFYLMSLSLYGYIFIALTCTASWAGKFLSDVMGPGEKSEYDYMEETERFDEVMDLAYSHYDTPTAQGIGLLYTGAELLPYILTFVVFGAVAFAPVIFLMKYLTVSKNHFIRFLQSTAIIVVFFALIIAYVIYAVYQWWKKEHLESILAAMEAEGEEVGLSDIQPKFLDNLIDKNMRKLFAKTYETHNIVAEAGAAPGEEGQCKVSVEQVTFARPGQKNEKS